MKKTATTIIIYILCAGTALFSITGDEAVSKLKKRMNSIEKLSGTISYSPMTGQSYSGKFMYMAPGKLFIKFSNPNGKVMVTNAKKLWLYDPSSKVCAIQDLDIESESSGGITAVLDGYSAEVITEKSGEITVKFNNSENEISDIILNLDSTFFIKRGKLLKKRKEKSPVQEKTEINEEGKEEAHKEVTEGKEQEHFSFSLSNLNFSPDILENIFDYKVPSDAQIIKNPLNIK